MPHYTQSSISNDGKEKVFKVQNVPSHFNVDNGRTVIVQGFMDFTSESCTNNFAKTSKLGTKFLYFQQPSCSQAQKEQADF